MKEPQINDAVLSHNDSLYMRSQISPSSAIVNNQKYSSQGGTTSVDTRFHFAQIDLIGSERKYIVPVGPNCRFSFALSEY